MPKSLAVKAETRRKALDRHAYDRRLERRTKWLERASVTPELLAESIETLRAGMKANKIIPAVVDRKGNVVGERQEVPDHAVRVKAASEVADFVRLVSGLTAEMKTDTKPAEAQVALIVNLPEWMTASKPAQITAPSRAEANEPVVDAEIMEGES